MKKALFMPFLRIPSGHHQVADAIIEYFQRADSSIQCEKMDLLSYSYGDLESVVSNFYIKWIHSFPAIYSWAYKRSARHNLNKKNRFYLYDLLFLKHMYQLILEKQPDFIICTHCLPSYLASRLKKLGLLTVPVINVYTDFFINDVWGIHEIDIHFVPDQQIKQSLLACGVAEERIFITGIPIHPKITKANKLPIHPDSLIRVLVTGGSLGVGLLKSLIDKTKANGKVRYIVLCGKNRPLYDELVRLGADHITPLPYIESKEKMNDLYNEIDVILTKPGGVTISECLYKGIPILVYHTLPGQEEINLQHLKQLGLVFHWNNWRQENIEDKIISMASSGNDLEKLKNNMTDYHSHLTSSEMMTTIGGILH